MNKDKPSVGNLRRLCEGLVFLTFLAGHAAAQPNPPLVTDPAWFTWYQNLLNQRLSECPLPRAQTYYFSQSGDDTTGNGSQANPWKTLAKAGQVLSAAAPAGNVAVLFKRGDVWRETVGIEVVTPNTTIADYGSGEKPLFTTFRPIGTPAAWTPAPGLANTYQRTKVQPVTWVKEDDDLDRPYSRQSSPSGVSAVEGSWYCDSANTLYIHPRHVSGGGTASDPRTDGKAYEYAGETHSGFLVLGDGTHVENIRAQGWGLNLTGVIQCHGIDSRVQGADRAVFVGCEAHYGVTHAMVHFGGGGGGGVATFVGCKAGLTTGWAGDGGTMFNTYATYGGNQTIFHQCIATHGTLPSSSFPAGERFGFGFYGHTDAQPGHQMGLTITYGCTTRDTTFGCSTPGGFNDLTPASTLQDVRCFMVNDVFEGGAGSGNYFQIGNANAARVNGRYLHMHPRPLWAAALAAWQAGGWAINCTVDADFSDQPINVALFNAPPGNPSNVQIWNSYIHVVVPPGVRFSIDWDFPNQSAGSTLVNSIITCTGGGTCDPNLGGPEALRGNAYCGVMPSGYAGDPSAVILGAPPGLDVAPSCGSALACSNTLLPAGVILGYDQLGQQRFRNTIGPVQSPPCGNCDGSLIVPVLTANDFQCFLNKFASGDPTANCDGSTTLPNLTANDFQCFLNVFAAGCQ